MKSNHFKVWLLQFLTDKESLDSVDISLIRNNLKDYGRISSTSPSEIVPGRKIIVGSLKYIASIDSYFRIVRAITETKNSFSVLTEDGINVPINNCRLLTIGDLKIIKDFEENLLITDEYPDDENQHISSISGNEKVAYVSHKQAIQPAFKLYTQYKGKWIIYRCKKCNFFHVGKDLSK